MNTVYLRDKNNNWKSFEYNEISDLKEMLLKNNISIGYEASIGDMASIGYRASIGDNIKLITGLFINGSKHSVTYVGEGKISIGCHTKEISWFKKNYKKIGETEGYLESEIKEYYNYILIAEKFYKGGTK